MGNINIEKKGTMFIFSAPSGGGKSSVIRRILENGTYEGHVMLVNEIVNGEINFLHSTGKTYSVGSSNTNANIYITIYLYTYLRLI